jgi:uncharacterized protein (DUF305 family)
MFLAGAVGYMAGRPDQPGASSADVGFLQDMIIHHEQAVEMSNVLIDSPAAPDVHTYAHDIVLSQQYEIGLMDAYLKRWGHRRGSGEGQVMAWMDMPLPAGRMPGMASAADLEAFEEATGSDKDAWFLRLMKAHHQGGVHMAEAAAERVSDGELRALAVRIADAQRSEIAEMEATRQKLSLTA